MTVFNKFLLALYLVLTTACDNGMDYIIHGDVGEPDTIYITSDPDSEVWVDSFMQSASIDEIDILWVIDGSCSMYSHQANLLAGIELMISSLPADVNWRLKMITAGDGKAIQQSTVFPLTRGDDATDALIMYSMLPPDGMEHGFSALKNYVLLDSYAKTWLRPNAALLTVFVSDEREQSIITSAEFISWYEGYRRDVFLSFIGNVYPEDSVCLYPPRIHDQVGIKYMDAVNYFMGSIVDICETDWSAGVADATQKIEPVTEVELTHLPYKNTISVFEDGVLMDTTNWKYIESDNVIEFDPAPSQSVLVEIGYSVKFYTLSP
jgi:hypothetical protein